MYSNVKEFKPITLLIPIGRICIQWIFVLNILAMAEVLLSMLLSWSTEPQAIFHLTTSEGSLKTHWNPCGCIELFCFVSEEYFCLQLPLFDTASDGKHWKIGVLQWILGKFYSCSYDCPLQVIPTLIITLIWPSYEIIALMVALPVSIEALYLSNFVKIENVSRRHYFLSKWIPITFWQLFWRLVSQ